MLLEDIPLNFKLNGFLRFLKQVNCMRESQMHTLEVRYILNIDI